MTIQALEAILIHREGVKQADTDSLTYFGIVVDKYWGRGCVGGAYQDMRSNKAIHYSK